LGGESPHLFIPENRPDVALFFMCERPESLSEGNARRKIPNSLSGESLPGRMGGFPGNFLDWIRLRLLVVLLEFVFERGLVTKPKWRSSE
jgi:hypothetical protein